MANITFLYNVHHAVPIKINIIVEKKILFTCGQLLNVIFLRLVNILYNPFYNPVSRFKRYMLPVSSFPVMKFKS